MKARPKYIDVRYHNSRDQHARKLIDYSNVHTQDNYGGYTNLGAHQRETHEIHIGNGIMVESGAQRWNIDFRLFHAHFCLWMAIHRLRRNSISCSHSHFSRAEFLKRQLWELHAAYVCLL